MFVVAKNPTRQILISTMRPDGASKADPVGLLVVDKPLGITSHGVVSQIRRLAGTRRVGHAGTLDPDASGVLVLGLGRATKLLGYIAGSSKEYVATIRLGVSTVTDDAAGSPLDAPGWKNPERNKTDATALIEEAMTRFRGSIEQIPSTVSAIKVDGKRAYARARAGEDVVLKPRAVTVDRFEIVRNGAESPLRFEDVVVELENQPARTVRVVDVDVHVECSTGTYVRALARDLGEALGSAGHLTALRRTRVGPWTIEDAVTLEGLWAASEEGQPLPLISLDQGALRVLENVLVSQEGADRFAHGVAPAPAECVNLPEGILEDDGHVVALSAVGEPHRVLGLLRVQDGRFKTQSVIVAR